VSLTKTTCPYCGVGCGVIAEVKDEKLIAVSGDQDHPANLGRLCIKGSTLPDTQYGAKRLLQPVVDGQTASWQQATEAVAGRFQSIIDEHGPDAVAFYLSGQLLTEDYYVANKLMKGFIGSANVDTNSRLCMASAVAAHKRAFGEDIVPCHYSDIDEASLFVLVGSNAAWAHPVIYQRISDAVQKRNAKVIVIDPRRTSTCDIATLHLPLKPGSDVSLFNGLLSHICASGNIDREFVNRHVSDFSDPGVCLTTVSTDTGIPVELIETFFEMYCEHEKVLTMFSQGVNQAVDGTDRGNAIINCHLATGRIGRPGMGPFSLTGQPNAMGGREVGGMANQLAAHMNFTPEDIERVQRFWNAPNLARQSGKLAVDMFNDIAAGKIKAVWIMGTNPAVSLPDSNRVRQALEDCPLVVVSDTVAETDTTRYANILLPALGWGEKDGTVTNSERRLSRQRAFIPTPGEAKADWAIICDVARAMGYGEAFEYSSVHEVFCEHAALSGFENAGERLFDISQMSRLDKTQYDALQPFTWPMSGRPFSNGQFQHPSGKSRMVVASFQNMVREPEHGYLMNTGRLRDQWHTMTRTGTSARLFQHQQHPWLEISAEDADRQALRNGQLVRLESNGAELVAPIRISDQVKTGGLFMPMHWSRTVSSLSANSLITANTDPVSGQPALKTATVTLSQADMNAWIRIISRHPLNTDEFCQRALFWTRVPVSNGYLYDLAFEENELADIVAKMDHAHPATGQFQYHDSLTGQERTLGFERSTPLWLVLYTPGNRISTDQIATLPEQADWLSLSPTAQSCTDTSPCVCTCFEVSEHQIHQSIINGSDSLAALGKALRCGTNCGSCIPEINRIIQQSESEKLLVAKGARS